jgi:hypothetical protein
MNTAMITCPNCGTEIALSQALQEQFRHENEARLAALTGQAEEKARADFALERQLLEEQLAGERKKRELAQQAELGLRKEKGALEDRARELDLEVAPGGQRERAPLRAAGPEAQGEGQADRRSAPCARRGQAQERSGLAAAAGRSLGDRRSSGCSPTPPACMAKSAGWSGRVFRGYRRSSWTRLRERSRT